MKEYFHQNEIPMTPPGPVFPGRLAAEQFPICVPASCPLKLLSAATVSWCWAAQSILIFSTQRSHCSLCHTPHYCAGIVIQQAVCNSTQQLLTVDMSPVCCVAEYDRPVLGLSKFCRWNVFWQLSPHTCGQLQTGFMQFP